VHAATTGAQRLTLVKPEPSPSVLRAEGLMKRYRKRTVVQDVSLTVESGEVVGLLGPNGAGKTTCFYMILGLVPIDAGAVTLDGRDLTHLPIFRRSRLGLSYLPSMRGRSRSTGATSRTCRSSAARAWGFRIFRRKRRSSASSPSRRTSRRCWSCRAWSARRSKGGWRDFSTTCT